MIFAERVLIDSLQVLMTAVQLEYCNNRSTWKALCIQVLAPCRQYTFQWASLQADFYHILSVCTATCYVERIQVFT